jgi:hypothetical protein
MHFRGQELEAFSTPISYHVTTIGNWTIIVREYSKEFGTWKASLGHPENGSLIETIGFSGQQALDILDRALNLAAKFPA